MKSIAKEYKKVCVTKNDFKIPSGLSTFIKCSCGNNPGQSFTYSLTLGNEAIYQSIPIILCVLTSSEKLKFSGETHSCPGGMTWGSTFIQGLSFLSPQMHQLANLAALAAIIYI